MTWSKDGQHKIVIVNNFFVMNQMYTDLLLWII